MPGAVGVARSRDRLVAARRHGDRALREARALRVDGAPERIERLLGEIVPERSSGRVLLQYAVLLGNRDRLIPELLVGDPDPGRRRPDQGVDLIHLPGLVALAEGGAAGEDLVHALAGVVAAEDPALEGGLQELDREVLAAGLGKPRL